MISETLYAATHFFQCHAILDQERYPGIEIPHILFENEVFLRLTGDLCLVVSLRLLSCLFVSINSRLCLAGPLVPLAKSSSISRSLSFVADIDRYRAVEYLLDCRALRPSFEGTVFCREIGRCDEEEEVDALDIGGMIATDIFLAGSVVLGIFSIAPEKAATVLGAITCRTDPAPPVKRT